MLLFVPPPLSAAIAAWVLFAPLDVALLYCCLAALDCLLHTALSIGTTTGRRIASLNVGCIVPQLVKRAGVLLFEQCPICPTAVFV